MVPRDQWDAYGGPKKIIFLIRDIDGLAMAGVSVESYHVVVLRSPRARLGSVLGMRNRLRRMRGRFDQWIHISTGPLRSTALDHDLPKIWIQSSLESPKRWRMRPRRLPDPRPIPEGVREPIYIRKKHSFWTRWRPVTVKNVNFSRAPGIVIAGSSDPILPHR